MQYIKHSQTKTLVDISWADIFDENLVSMYDYALDQTRSNYRESSSQSGHRYKTYAKEPYLLVPTLNQAFSIFHNNLDPDNIIIIVIFDAPYHSLSKWYSMPKMARYMKELRARNNNPLRDGIYYPHDLAQSDVFTLYYSPFTVFNVKSPTSNLLYSWRSDMKSLWEKCTQALLKNLLNYHSRKRNKLIVCSYSLRATSFLKTLPDNIEYVLLESTLPLPYSFSSQYSSTTINRDVDNMIINNNLLGQANGILENRMQHDTIIW